CKSLSSSAINIASPTPFKFHLFPHQCNYPFTLISLPSFLLWFITPAGKGTKQAWKNRLSSGGIAPYCLHTYLHYVCFGAIHPEFPRFFLLRQPAAGRRPALHCIQLR
ncbi:hypothetical protein LINPERPRIM_LOCUS16167, partial [Linum perenne]